MPLLGQRSHLHAHALLLSLTGAAACGETVQSIGSQGGGGASAATSSAGGAVGTGGEGGTSNGGGGASVLNCPALCATVDGACSADHSQYGPSVDSDEFCELLCPRWSEGQVGDTSGPTRACRAHHALQVEADPASHCAAAGPFGGTTCGTQCEAFCLAVVTFCNASVTVYATEQDCMSDCMGFAGHADPYAWMVGDTTDSFGCRGNAVLEASHDPTTFCPRVGGPNALIGNGYCVD